PHSSPPRAAPCFRDGTRSHPHRPRPPLDVRFPVGRSLLAEASCPRRSTVLPADRAARNQGPASGRSLRLPQPSSASPRALPRAERDAVEAVPVSHAEVGPLRGASSRSPAPYLAPRLRNPLPRNRAAATPSPALADRPLVPAAAHPPGHGGDLLEARERT